MITTSNLFFAGYLLTESAELVNVETAINGKSDKYVIFHFSTGDIKQDKSLETKYEYKTAVSNVREYIENYIRIKDIVYSMKANGGINGSKRDKRNFSKN